MLLFQRSATPSQNSRNTIRESQLLDGQASRHMLGTPSSENSSQSRPRAYTESSRRLSVFGGRPRSNTVTSTSSSYQSPASSMTSTDFSSRRSSQDGRSTSNLAAPPYERPESVAKSLISRGSRILMRQGSKFSLSSSLTLDEEEEMEREKYKFEVSELFQRGQKTRGKSSTNDGMKRTISEPFDFHHVTHTNSRQFPALGGVSDNELVTEFSAIRASQKPRAELKGIRADHLHFKNFSSEDLQQTESTLSSADSKAHSPVTPPRSRNASRNSNTPPGAQDMRLSRSIENFSRPNPRFSKSAISPIAPPPRTSSRAACSSPIPDTSCQAIDAILGLNPTVPELSYSSAEQSPSGPDSFDDMIDTSEVGAAVTTLDDSARQLRPSPLGSHPSELADVPEEDEASFWQGSPGRSSRPSTGRSSLRHAQSFPTTRMSYDRSMPSTRQSSQAIGHPPPGLEDLPFPKFDAEMSPRSIRGATAVKRFSIGLKPIDVDGWENDIDYSYEHAAESNCNFDWDRKSVDEEDGAGGYHTPNEVPNAPQATDDEPTNADFELISFFPGAFRPAQLDAARLAVPELEPTSALSASTVTEVITPIHPPDSPKVFDQTRTFMGSDYFKPNPSLLISSNFEPDMLREAMYEELLSGGDQNDHHFPFYAPAQETEPSQSVSPRSSRSPISKCNSQESIMLSRAASVVRKHRSSNSTCSLPELVHSVHCSRENMDHEIKHRSAEPLSTPNFSGPTPPHRRTKSLAKEMAHQSVLKKTTSGDDNKITEAEAPVAPTVVATPALAARDRAKSVSDVSVKRASSPMLNATGPAFATRMRSASAARGSGHGSRRSRASYSLFPSSGSTTPKSPI